MFHQRSRRLRTAILATTVAVSLTAGSLPAQAKPADPVFVMTNEADANRVLVYRGSPGDGLTPVDSVATGGLGTGDGLGSQGSVTLTDDGTRLLVVNAGSDTVSLFSVRGTRIHLIDVESTSGDQPISVDVHRNLVYVANAGSDTVSGFALTRRGLTPLDDAVHPLSGSGVGAAQVEFSPDGRTLAVTEKATNLITTFDVGRRGQLSDRRSTPSAGETPFGFEFSSRGDLVVSEAFGGAADASTLSTYSVLKGGGLSVLDGPVATTQTAACWVAISADGKYAYTTNTGSNTVSRFALSRGGELTLVDQTPTGAAPTDLDFSDDGDRLYVVDSGSDSVSIYDVERDGSLVPAGSLEGLPPSALGIAAG